MKKSTRLSKIFFLIIILPALIYNPISARIFTFATALSTQQDIALFYRLIKAESSFRALAYSQQKAIGLGQMKRSTYHYIVPELPHILIWFPPTNLYASARYLKYLQQKYQGNPSLALAAYNWGESNVDKRIASISINPQNDYRDKFWDIPETVAFLSKVLGENKGEKS